MKRVLCLIDSLGAGGAQRQIVGLASFLKEKGYEVNVVFYHNILFYENILREACVPYSYLDIAEKNIALFPVLFKHIKQVRPDVVISYLELPSMAACLVRVFNHSFKLIVSERNTTQHTGYLERIRFYLFRIADFIVPNAFTQADYINTCFSNLSPKVVTISNFVDLEYFTPPYKRVRREVPEIIVVASIWPPKNTLGFIEAIARIKERGFKFHVSWYGLIKERFEYNNQCQHKIDSLKVGDFIELKDKTTHIRECYQKADVFCLPSFYEGTPNVICEAMASGLPVLCSDVCDNSHYVHEGENGFLFDPHNLDQIVGAFDKFFSLNDKEYESFCSRSREIAEEKLSKERFVNDYLRLIES